MRRPLTVILIVLVFGCCYATPAQTDLLVLVAQLQKTPTDNTLREKVIKLAASTRPAPEVPEDARRPFVRANTAIKTAAAADDYANAIKQYQEALAIAPWWGDAYYNLARAQEMHKDYDAGIQSLKFYLMSSPAANDAREAQDHIYALEELRDKAWKAKAAADAAAKIEQDKQRAEQAKRDVITRIKNIVNGRAYDERLASYAQERAQIYGGLSRNEIMSGGTYYSFPFGCAHTWKFFDDHLELWAPGGACDRPMELKLIGESRGPDISDMRWYDGWANPADRERSKYSPEIPAFTRTWAYFNVENGYIFIGHAAGIPLNDAEVDRNHRYVMWVYKPF